MHSQQLHEPTDMKNYLVGDPGKIESFKTFLKSYDDKDFLTKPHFKEMMKMLSKINVNGTILDCGCGFGESTIHLQKKFNKECIGVEVDNEIVAVLNKYNTNKSISYKTGVVENLQFATNSFGLVFCSGVLQYISELDVALAQFYNISNEYVFIGRLALFKHHETVMVFQGGVYKVWIHNYDEMIQFFSRYFEIVDTDYSSEGYFIDNIGERVTCAHFLLKKKRFVAS